MANLVVCFNASETQVQALLKFCREKVDSSYIVSVRAIFSEDMVFSLSVFANRPEIYFGVYSRKSKAICTDIKQKLSLMLYQRQFFNLHLFIISRIKI